MTYDITITPRLERITLIKQRLENSTESGDTIYEFRSSQFTPKVISLPIELLVYRMENCRTFSAQQSEIAIDGLDKTFFEKGQELSSAQQIQHNILAKLAKQGADSITPIISVLDKDGQREAILITNTGVVVNGNRRLSAMRELMRKDDGSVDERFTNIQCAVLPDDTTRDEIDDIEADLQARPETKLDYDWIGDARLVRRQVDKGRTVKQVADRLRRSKGDIEKVLLALDEADLYLSEWVEKPGNYQLVTEGQQIFGDIPKNIDKKDQGLKNASRAIAWSIYENRDKITGRVYSLNAAFGRLATNVLDILEDQLDIQQDEDCDNETDDDFMIDIEADESDKDYTPIIEALKDDETKDQAVEVLLDACETALELDKGKKNEKAALKTLSQVNAKVVGIDVNSAGKSTLPAMLKQIETIKARLEKIEAEVIVRQKAVLDDGEQKENSV